MAETTKDAKDDHQDEVQWETPGKRKAEELSEGSPKHEDRVRTEEEADESGKKKKTLPTGQLTRERGILNSSPSVSNSTSHITFMDPMNPSHISPEQQTFLGALDSFGAVPLGSRTVENPGSEQLYPLYQQYILQQHGMLDRGMHVKHSDDSHPHSSLTSHTDASVIVPTDKNACRFRLREQPNENQRKSYKKENRCLLPNPLIICPVLSVEGTIPVRIIEGSVSVRLVDSEGKDLPQKSSSLEAIEGGLNHQLDDKLSTSFSLKVLSTSAGNQFRLLFTVTYVAEGIGSVQEFILSNTFLVHSNRKKTNRERPIVLDMKPNRGSTQMETEVWIKGKGFSNKVVITFGDKPGKVVDCTENLITVWAPTRIDIMQDTSVLVTVSNKYPSESINAEKRLNFTYQTNFTD